MQPFPFCAVAAATLFACPGGASAGSPAKGTAALAPEAESPLSIEVSFGYDTFYIFRGEELFEQVVWGQVEIDFALNDQFSLTLTPWYLHALEDNFTELDILPSVTYSGGFADLTLGYAGYIYPRGAFGGHEGIDDEHEINLTLEKTLGIFQLITLAAYNFDREGTYLEASLGASFAFCKAAALVPSIAVGYSSNYFAEDGFTHALLTLALPVQFSERTSVKPYVAGNIPMAVLDKGQEAELFGGVAFALSF